MSKNDKTLDPPHNTRAIIAESLGNKQDLLEIGRQREAIGGGDKKSAAAKSGLSKNDKPDPPHNTQKIIAESLGMSTGKAKLGGDHGNQYKKVPSLSKNDKVATPPHNTRAIIAESLGMSTGKVAQAELVRTDLLSINDKKLDPLKRGWQSSLGFYQ